MVKISDDNSRGCEEREIVGAEGSCGETRGMKMMKVVMTPAGGF